MNKKKRSLLIIKVILVLAVASGAGIAMYQATGSLGANDDVNTAPSAPPRALSVTIPILGEKHEPYDAYSSQPSAVIINDDSVLFLTELSDDLEICWYICGNVPNCAYRRQGGEWMRFVTEESAYREGFGAGLYNNLFGCHGFYISCPRGAAYYAYDYYYFDGDGELKLLFCGTFLDVIGDFNGDGENELLYFYHAGRDIYYYYIDEGDIYSFNVTGALQANFDDWEYIAADPFSVRNNDRNDGAFLPESMSGDVLLVTFQRNGVDYTAQIKFLMDAILITD